MVLVQSLLLSDSLALIRNENMVLVQSLLLSDSLALIGNESYSVNKLFRQIFSIPPLEKNRPGEMGLALV